MSAWQFASYFRALGSAKLGDAETTVEDRFGVVVDEESWEAFSASLRIGGPFERTAGCS